MQKVLGYRLVTSCVRPQASRELDNKGESVMKVVTLKNIPEVPAPGAAEHTDGYSGPVHRTRQTIIEPGESANFNCSIVNFSQGCNTGWHVHDCDQILIVTSGSGLGRHGNRAAGDQGR